MKMPDEPILRANNSVTAATAGVPRVSALVCTRNRGDSIVCAVGSLLRSDYTDFELIVVDQSTNEETASALKRFEGDPRLRI